MNEVNQMSYVEQQVEEELSRRVQEPERTTQRDQDLNRNLLQEHQNQRT